MFNYFQIKTFWFRIWASCHLLKSICAFASSTRVSETWPVLYRAEHHFCSLKGVSRETNYSWVMHCGKTDTAFRFHLEGLDFSVKPLVYGTFLMIVRCHRFQQGCFLRDFYHSAVYKVVVAWQNVMCSRRLLSAALHYMLFGWRFHPRHALHVACRKDSLSSFSLI